MKADRVGFPPLHHRSILPTSNKAGDNIIKIIQDTREQNPLKFKHPHITEVIVKKLSVGDYGCQYEDGFVVPVYFERKSIGDLWGTMTKGYTRFKKEIDRVKEADVLMFIAIEGSYTKVSKGYRYSKVKGISIHRTLNTIYLKYGIKAMYCTTRVEMAAQIAEFYSSYGKLRYMQARGSKR